jgi:hypothetical protein
MLLVGDNPFQGVSHLSQERAGSREGALSNPEYAAELVLSSIENGADGFMFTVNEMTLSIVKIMGKREIGKQQKLYALVPDVSELVRIASVSGGTVGLAKSLAKEMALSMNFKAVFNGVKGVVKTDPGSLLKSYLISEVYRLRSAGEKAKLTCLLLHEVLTDIGLALDMDWVFKTHIDFLTELKIKPGFETRNFSYLVKKFKEWDIDFNGITIAAPFNSIGFQMNPSKEDCEEKLRQIPGAEVIAISLLAGGFLKFPEAAEYLKSLPNLNGVAVGVSKKTHISETFNLLREKL